MHLKWAGNLAPHNSNYLKSLQDLMNFFIYGKIVSIYQCACICPRTAASSKLPAQLMNGAEGGENWPTLLRNTLQARGASIQFGR